MEQKKMTPILEKYVAFTKKWEGGLSRDTSDSASSYPCPTKHDGKSGWHTNAGITYAAWVQYFGKDNDERFFLMAPEDWFKVFKKGYWDGVKGDLFFVTKYCNNCDRSCMGERCKTSRNDASTCYTKLRSYGR